MSIAQRQIAHSTAAGAALSFVDVAAFCGGDCVAFVRDDVEHGVADGGVADGGAADVFFSALTAAEPSPNKPFSSATIRPKSLRECAHIPSRRVTVPIVQLTVEKSKREWGTSGEQAWNARERARKGKHTTN